MAYRQKYIKALDIASTEMYDEAKKTGKDGYYFWDEKIDLKVADSITLKVIEKLKKL